MFTLDKVTGSKEFATKDYTICRENTLNAIKEYINNHQLNGLFQIIEWVTETSGNIIDTIDFKIKS